jgi:hypothetical protein
LAERISGGTGWASLSVNPPAEEQIGGGEFLYFMRAATPNSRTFILATRTSTANSEPPPPFGIVRIRPGSPEEELMKNEAAVGVSYEETVDLSDDGEHVVIVNPETRQLEEIGHPGTTEIISRAPDNSPSACGLSVDGEDFGHSVQWHIGYHALATDDGSRVYFKMPPNGNCSAPPALYERNRETSKTTMIDPGAEQTPAEFIRASPDGREAYFVTRSNLDPADSVPSAQPLDADVYRWDERTGKSTCVTCVVPHANVVFSTMVSDDLSHVYFQSREKLVAGAGRKGRTNVYVVSDGQIRFVASPGGEGWLQYRSRPWLSSNGNILLFRAPAGPSMTADEVAKECPFLESGAEFSPCEELYRYEDAGNSIECVSCRHEAETTNSVGAPEAPFTSFGLSADGTTAAFATSEPLSAGDVNNDTDLYEWRSGTLHLISGGVGSFQSGSSAPQILALDADGSNILFGLVPPQGALTGFERDKVLNLYDARVGGGVIPPSQPQHCDGEFCQPSVQPPPPVPALSSESYAGAGNVGGGKQGCKRKSRHHGRCQKSGSKHRHHRHHGHRHAAKGKGGR